MKQTKTYRSGTRGLMLGAILGVIAVGCAASLAYDTYSDINTGTGNCRACHGDFRGPTSTKQPPTVFPSNNNHEMHRNSSNMGSTCNLCHTGTSADRFPVYIKSSNGTANNQGLGCTGCHMGVGLRKHHRVNGITVCLDCHDTDGEPPDENTKPPYYGTADTKVKNPANDVLASNTNENWSVGDFLGLDNDGNNLYDLADYAVGPFRLLSTAKQGNDIQVTYLTAGGRTNAIQAAGTADGPYADLAAAFKVPGVGLVTNNYLDVGGATNVARYYRLRGPVQ